MQPLLHDPNVWRPLVWCLWSVFGVLAVVALLAPETFARFGKVASCWVETKKALEVFDKRYDVDQYVAPHCRWLGAATLAALGFLAFRFW